MNISLGNFPSLSPPRVVDVSRALVHSVIFHRSFGLVSPESVDSEEFDGIIYVRVSDPNILSAVDGIIERLASMIDRALRVPSASTSTISVSVSLSFFELTGSKSWFQSKSDRLVWERWNLLATKINKGNSEVSVTEEEKNYFHQSLTQIVNENIKHREHLQFNIQTPQNTKTSTSASMNFPFECEICVNSDRVTGTVMPQSAEIEWTNSSSSDSGVVDDDSSSWGITSMLKKVIKQGPPSLGRTLQL